ncbi:hypothetical protein AVEN_148863-1 [Araneus ventricosus]|uniref:Uncharacterized protein n=1 Tax=Araneus ventricosus TaxID=182803 RepID=A0A4Y2SVV8_ARAVE|nr:hypothetical protein AVEN_148863-1 [Araneus ventricosus]
MKVKFLDDHNIFSFYIVMKLFSSNVNLMVGKRVLQRFVLDAKQIPSNVGDKLGDHLAIRRQICRLWRQNEGSRICENYGHISTRNAVMKKPPRKKFYVTSHPVGKGINTELLKRVKESLFGVLFAIQDGDLTGTQRYWKELLLVFISDLLSSRIIEL